MQNRIEKQFEGFLATPPLWETTFQEIFQFELPEVQTSLNHSVAKDLPSLATNFVMGKRVERFLEWVVQNNPNYELLAENIQISRNKITLGELDFLLKDLRTKQILHIEMVYKFYVYDPTFSSEIQRWIGPNRRDSLLQKIDKLKEKQFPLLFNNETKNLLDSLEIVAESIQQQACFKANLFIPRQLQNVNFPLINNKCIAGTWLKFKDFNSFEYKHFRYYAPKKQDWPVLPKHGETWFKHSEIIEEIETHIKRKKAPLIWMKKPGNRFERLFVVWW